MSYVINPSGKLVQLPDEVTADAIAHGGYKPASDTDVQAAKDEAARNAEAAQHPIQAAGEGLVKGAVDMVGSPFRALGGVMETPTAGALFPNTLGPGNPISAGLSQISGKNALAGIKDISQGLGGNAQEAEAGQNQYLREQGARAEQNPLASGTGELAGGIAGIAATGGMGLTGATTKLGAAAEGAILGAVQGAAAATDQAHEQDSYVKGEQLIAGAGLGAIIAGTLSLGGKYLGEKYAARKGLRSIPDLFDEQPFEGTRTLSGPDLEKINSAALGGEGLSKTELQDKIEREIAKRQARIQAGGEKSSGAPLTAKEVEEAIYSGRLGNPDEVNAFEQTTPAGEYPGASSTEATAVERPHVQSEAPADTQLTKPDGARMGGPDRELSENALNVPGKGPAEPPELRAALAGEDLHMRARQAKVDKLMVAIPEGATPGYILDMSEKERDALCSFVGVPKGASKETWKALADAVDQREGVMASAPVPEQVTQPSLPTTGVAPQTLPGTLPPTEPSAPPGPAFPQPGNYQGPPPGIPSEAAMGVSGGGTVQGGGNFRIDSPKTFKQYIKTVGHYVARKMAGRAIGAAIGSMTGGPVGGIIGYGIGQSLERPVYNAMGKVISKSAALSNKAIAAAVQLGTAAPEAAKLGIEANIVRNMFYKDSKTPEAAFQARQKELQALAANNGALIVDKVANAYGSLAHTEKGAVMSTTAAATKAVNYLLSNAPAASYDPDSLTPMSSARVPNRNDISDYARVYAAVMNPQSVLADIANGTVTKDQMSAVANNYPAWYQENIVKPYGDMLRARDAAGQPLLPSQRKVADIVLGASTGISNNDFVDRYGTQFGQALADQNLPLHKPRPSQKGNPSQSANTQTSRMLGPIQ